jgi:hypothetical protein
LFLPEFSCSTAPSGASRVFITFCSDLHNSSPPPPLLVAYLSE